MVKLYEINGTIYGEMDRVTWNDAFSVYGAEYFRKAKSLGLDEPTAGFLSCFANNSVIPWFKTDDNGNVVEREFIKIC